MRLTRLVVVVLASVVLSAAQDQKFALRVDVAVVSIDVEVTDANGRAVTSLTKEDFQLDEDGQPREILHFASADAPYAILSMFDCTGSLSDQWAFLQDAMLGFVQTLRPHDTIGIAAFGTQLIPLRDWVLRNDLRLDFQMPLPAQNSICDDTDFYESMISAAAKMRQLPTNRKGVIVFTDGVHEHIARRNVRMGGVVLPRFIDAADDKDFHSVLTAVRTSGARFYFVAMNTDLNPGTVNEILHPVAAYSPLPIYNMQQVRSRMELLAEGSGGRIVFPRTPDDYKPLYAQIAQELGSSYSLGFTPSAADDGGYHRVEVHVTNPALHTRQSRTGYGVSAMEKSPTPGR